MSKNPESSKSGRTWAYVGMSFGALVSTAANVAHSFVPPKTAPVWWPTGEPFNPKHWHPQAGAVLGAVFWPLALFIATEILVRIRWPEMWVWALVRFAGLLPVAAVAAIVSYKHLSALLVYYGEDQMTGRIGPLAVDGLMIMATGALVATAAHTATATVAATKRAKSKTEAATPVPDATDTTGPVDDSAGVKVSGRKRAAKSAPAGVRSDGAATAAKVAAALAEHPQMSTAELAAALNMSERTARRHVRALTPAGA